MKRKWCTKPHALSLTPLSVTYPWLRARTHTHTHTHTHLKFQKTVFTIVSRFVSFVRFMCDLMIFSLNVWFNPIVAPPPPHTHTHDPLPRKYSRMKRPHVQRQMKIFGGYNESTFNTVHFDDKSSHGGEILSAPPLPPSKNKTKTTTNNRPTNKKVKDFKFGILIHSV